MQSHGEMKLGGRVISSPYSSLKYTAVFPLGLGEQSAKA